MLCFLGGLWSENSLITGLYKVHEGIKWKAPCKIAEKEVILEYKAQNLASSKSSATIYLYIFKYVQQTLVWKNIHSENHIACIPLGTSIPSDWWWSHPLHSVYASSQQCAQLDSTAVEVQPHLSGFHELLKQWAIVEVIIPWMLLLSRSRCQAAKGDITMGKWGNTVKERNFVFSKAIHGFVQIEVTSWGYFYTASGNSQVLQSWETYIPFISHISR